MKRKRKLPDFDKMTVDQERRWFQTHDLTEYLRETDVVELDIDLPGTDIIMIRLPKTMKRKLDRAARTRGLRGASTYARMVLTDHFEKAA